MIYLLIIFQQIVMWFVIRMIVKQEPTSSVDLFVMLGLHVICLIPFLGLFVSLGSLGYVISETMDEKLSEFIAKKIYLVKDRE